MQTIAIRLDNTNLARINLHFDLSDDDLAYLKEATKEVTGALYFVARINEGSSSWEVMTPKYLNDHYEAPPGLFTSREFMRLDVKKKPKQLHSVAITAVFDTKTLEQAEYIDKAFQDLADLIICENSSTASMYRTKTLSD